MARLAEANHYESIIAVIDIAEANQEDLAKTGADFASLLKEY